MNIYNILPPELQLMIREKVYELDKYEHKIKMRISFYAIDHLKVNFESYNLDYVKIFNVRKKLPILYNKTNEKKDIYVYKFAFTPVTLVPFGGFKQEYIRKLL